MRFHIGLSFRWKTIKRFLLPFLVGFLAYFGFNNLLGGFDFGFIQTYAYQNSNTSYNITFQDYNSQLDSTGCHDISILQYFKYIIDNVNFDTSYYQVFATLPTYENYSLDYYDYTINLYLIPTSQIQNNYLLYRATNNANQVGMSYQYGFNISPYYNTYNYYLTLRKNYGSHYEHCSLSSNDYQNDVATIHFIDFIQNGGWSSNTRNNVNDWGLLNQNSNSTYASFFEQNNSSISNNSSYNSTLWYYYSSVKYSYIPTDMSSNTFWYYKNINLVDEGKTYSPGDTFDSYYDLHTPTTQNTFIGYKTSLDTFYTSLSPSLVNNYNLTLSFKVPQSVLGYYQTPQEYLDNTSFDFVCGGRVDHTNYYSYETFNCSLSKSYNLTTNSIEYTFNNLSTSQSLTNYDKIYVSIKTNYLQSDVSTTVFDLKYSYNLGSFYNTSYKGAIYENFSNLPLNFKTYISSNNSVYDSDLFVYSKNFKDFNIKTLGFSNTTQSLNYVVGNSVLGSPYDDDNFIQTTISNNIDNGVMIYQENGTSQLSNLHLFFNKGMIISFNNTSSSTFYYIDSSGDIVSNNFEKPIITSDDNYDISYYTGYVSNFINDLSSSCLVISIYTQDFYNGLPLIFQTFIFVMFILGCIYIIYNLIRK